MQMETELQSVHNNYVFNKIKTIEDQFSYLERLLSHWAFDSNFNSSYEDIDVVYHYKEVHNIYRNLLIMEGSNPLIERIQLFLQKPNEVVFSKTGYTFLEENDPSGSYNQLLLNERNISWKQSLSSIENRNESRDSSLYLTHMLPGGSNQAYGSLIVYLNKAKLADLITSPYEGGSVFLFRNENHWLFGDKEQVGPTAMQKAIFSEIDKQTNDPAAPFQFEWENQSYTVTYAEFNRLNEKWYYVSAAPLTAITAPVVFISKLFIILSFVIFISAIILSFIASRQLYSPIDKLIKKVNGNTMIKVENEFELIESKWNTLSNNSETLQKHLKQQLPHLREGFLLQLLQGYLYSYQDKDLQARMLHYGWNVENKKYQVLFIQLFGLNKKEGKFSDGDEGLATFLAANIIEELVQRSNLEAELINFHDLSLGLLVTYSNFETRENIDKLVTEFSEEIIKFINSIGIMDVSISISRITDSIKRVHALFEETKNSLGFRNLQEKNQIIDIEKMDYLMSNHDTLDYPFDLEKEITHAIRLRNEALAVKLVEDFVFSLSQKNLSEAMLKQGSLQLLGSILHIVLQSGLMEEFVKDGANLYGQLYQIRDTERISQWFQSKIIIPIIRELSLKQDQRARLLVEKVVIIMREEYMKDISLDYCADHIKMSPSILSKVFKEITGWNFIDYLTSIRLEKAKDLLIDTDMKINYIAESIGYKHSYFNRIFKKSEGVTPSQFREIMRKKIV